LYTVDRIAPAIDGGHVAVLAEVAPRETYAPPWGMVALGFALKRFRYLDIPGDLSRLLEAARQRQPV
ncbi:MAG: hypothetical protein N2444_09050, partial [Methylocystis sp.]|nr:hypothetical protein [Methylocystis sp.]